MDTTPPKITFRFVDEWSLICINLAELAAAKTNRVCRLLGYRIEDWVGVKTIDSLQPSTWLQNGRQSIQK
jgi:hypothetical protein